MALTGQFGRVCTNWKFPLARSVPWSPCTESEQAVKACLLGHLIKPGGILAEEPLFNSFPWQRLSLSRQFQKKAHDWKPPRETQCPSPPATTAGQMRRRFCKFWGLLPTCLHLFYRTPLSGRWFQWRKGHSKLGVAPLLKPFDERNPQISGCVASPLPVVFCLKYFFRTGTVSPQDSTALGTTS